MCTVLILGVNHRWCGHSKSPVHCPDRRFRLNADFQASDQVTFWRRPGGNTQFYSTQLSEALIIIICTRNWLYLTSARLGSSAAAKTLPVRVFQGWWRKTASTITLVSNPKGGHHIGNRSSRQLFKSVSFFSGKVWLQYSLTSGSNSKSAKVTNLYGITIR